MPLLDSIPRIRGLVGRPRHRPRRLFADRGYDYDKYRRLLRARGDLDWSRCAIDSVNMRALKRCLYGFRQAVTGVGGW
jgi:hypothetical protein